MAPEPPQARSVQAWARQNERAILERVQASDGFSKAVGSFGKSTGMDAAADSLHELSEALCRCCLREAGCAMQDGGPLAAAQAEVDDLRHKLTQCGLSAMKQVNALRAGGHSGSDLQEDTITFHEPMAYLDKGSKELVMSIVCDKVRQLDTGRAPQSLVEALVRHTESQNELGGACAKELEETKAELEKSRKETQIARAMLEAAEERTARLGRELDEARQQLAETQAALEELREQEAALRAAYAELEERVARQLEEIEEHKAEIERQGKELERQQEEIERQQEEMERQRGEIARLGEELEEEKAANAELREQVAALTAQIDAYLKQIAGLEKDLEVLQARYDVLEKEADEMREELRRRNNTRTHGTQTTLTGPKLDEQVAEIKRLKVMLEELQMKLKELMDRYRRKFGSDAKAIADDLGIADLVKEDTVFQRLYDDAMDRVERLDKLRAKIRKERQELAGKSAVDVDSSLEGSVLAAVENSKLKGLRRALGGSEQPPSSLAEPAPEAPPRQKSKSTTSLPTLCQPAKPLSVLNMDFGAGRRSSMRQLGQVC